MFPDEPVPEIAGPQMATCLRAFWECCWVHGIDPRNPGHASDIAPEILEELEHFSSVEPDQPALLCPMVSMRRPTRPSMWRPSSQLSTSPGITLQVRQSRLWKAGGPEGLAALEARNAAERQALLRYAPREVSSGFARTRNNPDEGTGGLVVVRDEGVDVLDEFGTAPEGLTIERLFGEDREPDFDLV
jgi:hypothetical protein